MSALAIAAIVFTCVLGSAWLGLHFRSVLPKHHLSDDTMSVVKLGTGLVATLSALVLGLLIASAKNYYDKISDEVTQTAAKVVLLDRTLARYGPETKEVRGMLQSSFASVVQLMFSEEGLEAAKMDSRERQAKFEQFQEKLQELTARSDAQRVLQSRALDISNDLAQMRWIVIEQKEGSVSTPLLVVLVLWLGVIFAGFGLVSAKNATVIAVLVLCALSVAGSIFLIEEMDRPFAGLMKIPGAPMRSALAHLGQ